MNVDVEHAYNTTKFKSLNEDIEGNETPEAEEPHFD
jgi:hypothetical protein